ncbi:deoxyribonuclease-2-alpha-like isoform X1 [Trematomus bernacchii]|uniref:deoxyribonuclease-2-alpha-like isoform X1 n=1 Tax=Trematomus bernacchii TaxID=40690 RepID=UPI00146A8627|nr:deoxyribonuclease-2-alpha-like isoform X1 [Trematomus bernacchii]
MAGYRTMMGLLLTVGIVFQLSESRVTCRNDEGNEVDWYILYKLPLGHSDNGLSYLYMDESTDGWKLSKHTIDSSSGTLANTLEPLLDYYVRKTEGFGYILYNDQLEKKTVSSSYGHSKGVVMLDRATGVWLSHSTPKFPTDQSKSFWPESGNVNGQTFLCVTYSYGTFKEIGLQLMYIHPYAYDYVIPKTFHMELQKVALKTGYPGKEPFSSVTFLRSEGGEFFHSFAKYTRFNDDLYSGLIVDDMEENLYVKGWGNKGRSVLLPSDCSTPHHHVYNVKKVKLLETVYNDTQDHSKWCVAPISGWTCIADLNRHESQKYRGGGAICIKDVAVAKAFWTTIKTYV